MVEGREAGAGEPGSAGTLGREGGEQQGLDEALVGDEPLSSLPYFSSRYARTLAWNVAPPRPRSAAGP